ncbi:MULTISPECIES: hypothetical protein [unclassified Gordonia (in: high G+C Gram-positive bacteria)]|uniref:hypothetical protein n=1 Tax=unclassified Gordonia (in: high G+C Gram-positive bacteria) TaxID=2657482 RepID=UPI0019653CC5|nr:MULTISPECIES: hypothetical protein [unclassified Gordonia (in: high G+C Gram-positive bacteria)]MBN0974581.1 hypothetical protein [Gordonia sp. BP-119]MBN0984377.1 hypothetical protein [Gordonia sp. BP-94]
MAVDNISSDDQDIIDAIVGTIQSADSNPEEIRPHVANIVAYCDLLMVKDPRLREFVTAMNSHASKKAIAAWASGAYSSVEASPWNDLADGLAEFLS